MELANNILAVIEPKIRPTEIKIDALAEEKPDEAKANQTSVIATLKPMVLINGYQFSPKDITFFELDLSQILPTCKLSLTDSAGKFAVGSYPRDGDFFTILINSKNQETFKSIHMDFDIASCDAPKAGNTGSATFNIEGFCKIPKIYGEDCKHFENGTSLDHMKLVSADLELGLATNIDAADDSQVRIMAYEPYMDFIKTIVKESYVGEESFQKFWVDPYYYLNYVDVNALFNSPNPPILEFAESLASAAESMTPSEEDKKNADFGNDIEVPLLLTNHIKFMGNNAFIEAHELINNSAEISAKAGYAREVTIYDNNGDKKKQEFRIEPLGGKDLKELEEPLRGNRNDKRHLDQIKYKYIGRQEAGDDGLGNVHPNAAFAQLHNTQNAMEVQKMKLKVTLNSFNPSLYKYQKIPVLMYIVNKKAIEQNERIKGDKKELGMDKDEPFNLGEDTESITPGRSPSNALDTFLSGYYIIEDIVYRTSDGETKQHVTLLRREWPTRTENLLNPPGLAEDATPEKKAENIKENSPPPAPPEPTPAPTPEPTPPVEEPVFTIDPELIKRRNGIGSWFDYTGKLKWNADDISLVTETPKIKLTFKGASGHEVQATVTMEDKFTPGPGGYGQIPYNTEFTVAKNTFKDKEGKYTIDIVLTYKDQTVTETVNWEFYKWTPDKIYDQGAIRSGKLLYTWQTISAKEAGNFIGQYTLKGEATKDGNGPRNGKIEGTDINDVIKRTENAGQSEA
jgi:hypothetical protein